MAAVNEKFVETIEVKEPGEGAPMVLNTRPLFKLMVERKASDLFFTSNSPIKVKIEGLDWTHEVHGVRSGRYSASCRQ
jgi:hypothetical protein